MFFVSLFTVLQNISDQLISNETSVSATDIIQKFRAKLHFFRRKKKCVVPVEIESSMM
jgi:hypothetical protein